MPNETKVATDVIQALEEQVQQNQKEIELLKKEIEQLRAELGLSSTEPDEFESLFSKGDVLEFGTFGNDPIKGKVNWITPYLISVTTSDEESPAEVLIFKQSLTYIRKPQEKSIIVRKGMYL
ncbi:hypothetical protein HYR99_03780 [Candidatus Poribacteria bacterium]|nr:hypothetical protein [Candidatus Poribacteria bacterium]